MPAINRVNCWIECDGQKLPEYEIKHTKGPREAGNSVECYIESEEGKVRASTRPTDVFSGDIYDAYISVEDV